ncbi:MAG TPA: FkbM family methyltransferase [Verrucomicrobiae bacterium]|nr:FkbM family methyltransferase [Verrucomicrobiae bacterium]
MVGAIARHSRTLGQFPRLRDRALYIYGRILRRVSWPLPGRHSAVQVRLRDQPDPFHLRLSSTDWLVLEEIFQHEEYTFVRDVIKDAGLIVDLGANVGYSLRYWQTLFPNAQILAMEPEPNNFLMCARNVGSAGLAKQVTLLQAAAGARRELLRLVDGGEGEWAYRTEGGASQRGCAVDVLPLGEVLAQHVKGRKIDLLKCDIEGAEKDLFAHCAPWIEMVNAIVVELHPPYTLAELRSALAQSGAHFEVTVQINRKLCPLVLLQRQKSSSER